MQVTQIIHIGFSDSVHNTKIQTVEDIIELRFASDIFAVFDA